MALLEKVFKAAVDYKASDVHVAPGEPIIFRRLGTFIKLKSGNLPPEKTRELIFELLSPAQQESLTSNLQLDFAYEVEGVGRLRGSAMLHNNGLGAVFRIIPPTIPTLAQLGLPDIVRQALDNHQGLILVTGPTGHGKSTTLAAMVDYINSNRSHHILTVEDPIEFIHPLKRGVVNQRQLDRDTLSYANALRGALREDPDVIVIGELRDLETIALAISAAETGHLVIGTLATSTAPKSVDRIIDAFPPGEQNQVRAMVSESLKAVVSQRLIPNKAGTGMELALEILIGTLSVANIIRDAKTFQLQSLMQTGKNIGMQLMDDSLLKLVKEEKIAVEQALAVASNKKLFQA